MKVFNLVIDGKPYRVEIEDPWAKPLRLIVNGRSYVVETQNSASVPPQPAPVASPPSERAGSNPVAPVSASVSGGKVTAPLPGKVLSITVKVGDQVKYGDEVCVLEAMKMEQSIKSPYVGVVKAISVSPGQNVSHGQALVELA
ncbi:MAG: acetyl-CoA carboxylase biotin carboxyl carrier protein subunit [Chloroflexi bacterium]|nr:acetyl-CoA carboxylase biotin carboxyl carrier protein subunit [Chloroflexota bacterium]